MWWWVRSYDTETKRNLTEARQRELKRIAFASLPLDLAIKNVKGNGERKVAVFSDADCPFCARLENDLKNVDNVTIYTFLYPIDQLHPDAARKSKAIWCAPDKVKAWDEFFVSGKLPDNAGNCATPFERHGRARRQAAGHRHADAGVRRRLDRPRRAAGGADRAAELAQSDIEVKKLAGEEVARLRSTPFPHRENSSMAIMDFLKKQFIEIIEWTDDSRDTLSFRFPDDDKEIKRGAQLIVRESQIAQFVYLGEFGDTFGPGKHTLTTDNIPILTNLKGWKYGFESPFKADVYYVVTRLFTGNKWGTVESR